MRQRVCGGRSASRNRSAGFGTALQHAAERVLGLETVWRSSARARCACKPHRAPDCRCQARLRTFILALIPEGKTAGSGPPLPPVTWPAVPPPLATRRPTAACRPRPGPWRALAPAGWPRRALLRTPRRERQRATCASAVATDAGPTAKDESLRWHAACHRLGCWGQAGSAGTCAERCGGAFSLSALLRREEGGRRPAEGPEASESVAGAGRRRFVGRGCTSIAQFSRASRGRMRRPLAPLVWPAERGLLLRFGEPPSSLETALSRPLASSDPLYGWLVPREARKVPSTQYATFVGRVCGRRKCQSAISGRTCFPNDMDRARATDE